ncbi:MAG: hypothetical protein JWP02_2478 [Acidimicrobiales bacterium]|nr:hypothetical protein [Acidimicrobiales bacterium]
MNAIHTPTENAAFVESHDRQHAQDANEDHRGLQDAGGLEAESGGFALALHDEEQDDAGADAGDAVRYQREQRLTP